MAEKQSLWRRLTNNVLSRDEMMGAVVVIGMLIILIIIADKLL